MFTLKIRFSIPSQFKPNALVQIATHRNAGEEQERGIRRGDRAVSQVQDLADVRDLETAALAPFGRDVFRLGRASELPLR